MTDHIQKYLSDCNLDRGLDYPLPTSLVPYSFRIPSVEKSWHLELNASMCVTNVFSPKNKTLRVDWSQHIKDDEKEDSEENEGLCAFELVSPLNDAIIN